MNPSHLLPSFNRLKWKSGPEWQLVMEWVKSEYRGGIVANCFPGGSSGHVIGHD